MENIDNSLSQYANQYPSFRWLFLILLASGIALIAYKIIDLTIPAIVKQISQLADSAKDNDKLLRWRRLETFLHVFLATGKVVVFFLSIYFAWKVLNPNSSPAAIVGASAIAILMISAVAGPLLRDITFGAVIIAERWYNVGDYIQIEPFNKLSGIVDGVTLRSTKLRGLNGEIIRIHNQSIQAVRMTPRGVKTLAFEVFVSDRIEGERLVKLTLEAIPRSATMVQTEFAITETEKINDHFYRITATGQTIPGREWLIEDFATAAIKEADQANRKIIIHGPIVRYADAGAERRFKRAVRQNSDKPK